MGNTVRTHCFRTLSGVPPSRQHRESAGDAGARHPSRNKDGAVVERSAFVDRQREVTIDNHQRERVDADQPSPLL